MPRSAHRAVAPLPARRRLAVAVSGGVDSLCALLLLKRQGHDVFALHALLTPNAEIPGALEQICRNLGVELHVLDLREIFSREIIAGHMDSLLAGLTPNPCVRCNRQIKFGAIFNAAMALGADALATGHYCRLGSPLADGTRLLAPALDERKDQSYFLTLVERRIVTRLEFPLAALTKKQCRHMVVSAGLSAPLPRESQDICFMANGSPLPHGRAWREAFFSRGPILLREAGQENIPLEHLRRIGNHCGLANYTTGQRKGLNCSWTAPLYVRERHIQSNCLVVSPISMLRINGCQVSVPNFFIPHHLWPSRTLVRLRYRQPLAPCRVSKHGRTLQIVLDQPRFATAPGQIAAFHDQRGSLLGGGIITAISFAGSDQ